MCSLRLALYGHPLSGFSWEQHCHFALSKVGFEALEGWECVFVHKKLGLFLSVYVDDFKLVGRAEHLQEGWNLIRKHLRLDPPTPLGDYLGCGQKEAHIPKGILRESLRDVLPLVSGEFVATEASTATMAGDAPPTSGDISPQGGKRGAKALPKGKDSPRDKSKRPREEKSSHPSNAGGGRSRTPSRAAAAARGGVTPLAPQFGRSDMICRASPTSAFNDVLISLGSPSVP